MKIPANKIRSMQDKIELLRVAVEALRESMTEALDSKSDKFRESEKGEKIESCISALDDCENNLQSAYDDLGNVELDD